MRRERSGSQTLRPPDSLDLLGFAPSSAPKTTPDAPATPSLTVKAPTLNIRSGPGSTYPISDSVRQGARLIVTGQHNGCAWLKVTLGAAEAWISGSPEYVALNVPCKSVPVAPAPPLPVAATAPAAGVPCAGQRQVGWPACRPASSSWAQRPGIWTMP